MIDELREREFPITRDWAYLDHATFGPPPACHVRAATAILQGLSARGSAALEGERLLEEVRTEAAALLHCEPRQVALLRSTSEGLGLLAQGLDWRPGDEVVVYEREFEGCLAPFLRLRDLGVRIRVVPDLGRARFDIEDVERALTPRTRAVCFSVVNRSHGTRAPVEAIGTLCRERGLWFALDAAQALGVLRLDPAALGADLLAAHGYKFLCSGFGLALTYCSERALAELRVPLAGWKNARIGDGLALELVSGAARFEPTMSSIPLLAGTVESLRLLHSVDDAERERRALGLVRTAAEDLRERGYELVSSLRPEEASALLSVRHPSIAADELAAQLRSARIASAAVDGCLRVSAHFYNTADDVEALLAALPPA